MSFDVIHDTTLGWQSTGYPQTFIDRGYPAAKFNSDASNFPYGVVPQEEIDLEALNKKNNYNQMIHDSILADREQEIADQARANAIARYGTAGGKARFKKDKKRLERLSARYETTNNERRKARIQERGDYLASAREGAKDLSDEPGSGFEDFVE